MYFKQFPKIFYDFPQDNTSTTLQILTDITTNVRIRKQILENVTIYDEYDIQEGETPEIVAEKVYGDPELHWVIMLANQRYDYLRDFPMTEYELRQYIANKYEYPEHVHHYERNGIVVEGVAKLKLPSSVTPLIKFGYTTNLLQNQREITHDFITMYPYANARIESIDSATNIAVILLDYGRFSPGDLVSLNGIRYDESLGKNVYTTIINFNVPTNGFTLNDEYHPVTNEEYEIRENESKRRIKLISKNLIDQFVKEFQNLVKP